LGVDVNKEPRVKKILVSFGERRLRGEIGKVFVGGECCPKVGLRDVFDRDMSIWTKEERRFIWNAHFDFLVIDKDHKPITAIEFDGSQHSNSQQRHRDTLKDTICRKASLPLMRFSTTDLHPTPGLDDQTWASFMMSVKAVAGQSADQVFQLILEYLKWSVSEINKGEENSSLTRGFVPFFSVEEFAQILINSKHSQENALIILQLKAIIHDIKGKMIEVNPDLTDDEFAEYMTSILEKSEGQSQ
jgi:hypothetical protein